MARSPVRIHPRVRAGGGRRRRFFLVALTIAAVAASASTAVGAGDPREQVRAIAAVRSWELSFRYALDTRYRNDFGGGMGEENENLIDAECTVRFERSRRRYWYHGTGECRFSLSTSQVSRMGEYRMATTSYGGGTTPVEENLDFNALYFDFDRFAYGFRVNPGEIQGVGGDVGVGIRGSTVSTSNVTDTFLREAAESGREIPLSEMVRAMAPPEDISSDWIPSFPVAGSRPLPFFGLTMAGSLTDSAGGVLTWILAPGDGTKEPFLAEHEPAIPGFDRSEHWVHVHPPSADDIAEVESTWEAAMAGHRAIEEADAAGSTGELDRPWLYLVDPDGPGPATGCGDRLVPVPLAGPGAEGEDGFSLLAGADRRGIEELAPAMAGMLATRLMHASPAVGTAQRNPLRENLLILDEVRLSGGVATVALDGQVDETECDDRRILGQVRETLRQVESIQSVVVVLNDRLLEVR